MSEFQRNIFHNFSSQNFLKLHVIDNLATNLIEPKVFWYKTSELGKIFNIDYDASFLKAIMGMTP